MHRFTAGKVFAQFPTEKLLALCWIPLSIVINTEMYVTPSEHVLVVQCNPTMHKLNILAYSLSNMLKLICNLQESQSARWSL